MTAAQPAGSGNWDDDGSKRRAPDAKLEATFAYEDENGRTLFCVEKWRNPQGWEPRKSITQYQLLSPKDYLVIDNEEKKKCKEVKGVCHYYSVADVRLIPYRLPELLKADAGSLVLILEGEGKVDAARGLGFRPRSFC